MADFPIYEFESISGKKFTKEVQDKINYVMSRTLHLYPNKVVEGLNAMYRKFAENTVLQARRLAGYESNDEFFEDFGFTYVNKTKASIEKKKNLKELDDFLNNDEVIKEYYQNSLYPNILYSQKNMYLESFKNILIKRLEHLKLSFTVDEIYNHLQEELSKGLSKFTAKEKAVSMRRSLDGQYLREYQSFPVYNDFSSMELGGEVSNLVDDLKPTKEELKPVEENLDSKGKENTQEKTKNNELEEKYQKAKKFYSESKTISSLEQALKLFKELGDYEDSSVLYEDCEDLINSLDNEKVSQINVLVDEAIKLFNTQELVDEAKVDTIIKKIKKIDSRNHYADEISWCKEMIASSPYGHQISFKAAYVMKKSDDKRHNDLITYGMYNFFVRKLISNAGTLSLLTNDIYKKMTDKDFKDFKNALEDLCKTNMYKDVNSLNELIIYDSGKIIHDAYLNGAKKYVNFSKLKEETLSHAAEYIKKVNNMFYLFSEVYKFKASDEAVFNMLYLISSIYDDAKKVMKAKNVDHYLDSGYKKFVEETILKRYKKIQDDLKAKEQERLKRLEEEKKARFKAYWDNHQDLYNCLVKEEEDLKESIRISKNELKYLSEIELIKKYESDITRLEQEISKLNFFQGRKKKELTLEVESIKQKLSETQNTLKEKESRIKDKIKSEELRVKEIKEELTKSR